MKETAMNTGISTDFQTVLHRAENRGHADHGWLESYHSFSFAGYFDPEKTNFGLLRVLNDDKVAGGRGFGRHPHENMEIISIPIEGALEHEDSMGTKRVILKNDVQVMSAGTGVHHSEYNKNSDKEVKFLQIWIFPKIQNVAPRYDQKTYDPALRHNAIQRIVSPMDDSSDTIKINQDAYLSMARIEGGKQLTYDVLKEDNGVYVFALSGDVQVHGETLGARDAMGLWGGRSFVLEAAGDSEILFIEIPMKQ